LIAQAYRGESIAPLNAVLAGRTAHPLGHYLDVWNQIARSLLMGEAVIVVALIFVAWPRLRHAVDARFGSVPAQVALPAHFRLSRNRFVLVSGVIAVVVGVQLFTIATQREYWPFSNYSMYSHDQGATMTWIRVYGVTPEGEFNLDPEVYLKPFDGTRLSLGLEWCVIDRPDAVTDEAMRNLYALYETGRTRRKHPGPPLVALRLYRQTWSLDPSLANVDRPDVNELLHELAVTN
jgi:hypothetical protein